MQAKLSLGMSPECVKYGQIVHGQTFPLTSNRAMNYPYSVMLPTQYNLERWNINNYGGITILVLYTVSLKGFYKCLAHIH